MKCEGGSKPGNMKKKNAHERHLRPALPLCFPLYAANDGELLKLIPSRLEFDRLPAGEGELDNEDENDEPNEVSAPPTPDIVE